MDTAALAAPPPPLPPFGALLRDWRRRRRLSQLDLACEAEVSARHLSWVETGRSTPSREMVLRLAERLGVPPRERNALLVAAGHAPMYPERPLSDPALRAAREAVSRVLAAHDPYPALAVDRRWTLVEANAALPPLLAGVEDAALLAPPLNVLRLGLHPRGLAPRIVNLAEWRAHLIGRLAHEAALTASPALVSLLAELRAYPAPPPLPRAAIPDPLATVAVPLRLRVEGRAEPLSFLGTTTVFGTAVDVTLSELCVEAFLPADAATAEALRAMAAARA